MDTSWDTDSKLPLPTSLIKIEPSNAESLTPKKSSPSEELDKSLFKFKGRIPRSHPSVKWSNQCEYQCKICNKKSNCDMRSHVSSAHKFSMEEYRKIHGDMVVVEKFHVCKICKGRHLHTTQELTRHFKTYHQMEIIEYWKTFIKNPQPSNPEGQEGEASSGSNDEADEPNTKVVVKKKKISTSHPAYQWSQQCEFNCQEPDCTSRFRVQQVLKEHIIKHHSMEVYEYYDKYGDFQTKEVIHPCLICECELPHNYNNLDRHFKREHDMGVIDYYNQHISKTPEAEVTESGGAEAASEHIRMSREALKWSNKCHFKCFECITVEFSTRDNRKFSQHLKTAHGMLVSAYTEKHKSTMSTRIFHPCLLCGKNITHTQDTLRQHMNLSHQKLALGIYYEKAVKRVNAAKQWINKCTFACMTCGQFQTHERNAFVKHLKNIHNYADANEYTRKFHLESLMSDCEMHKCCICNKEVLQVEHAISRHVKSKHGMDYLTYYMMHVDPLKPGEVEILPLAEVESGPNDSNKRKGDMGTDSNVAKKARMALTKYDFEVVSEYRKWVNQCRFDCQLCPNLQSKDHSALYKHLKDVHKCTGPAYREKFGQSMMSHEKTFICKIKDCSEESLHHYRGISKHLQKYHEGLAPKDYFAQHVYEKSHSQQTEDGDKKAEDLNANVDKPDKDGGQPDTPGKKNVDLCQFKVGVKLQDVLKSGPKRLQHEDVSDFLTPSNKNSAEGKTGVKKEETDLEWFCQYDECGVPFKHKAKLESHIVEAHDCSIDEYLSIYDKFDSSINRQRSSVSTMGENDEDEDEDDTGASEADFDQRQILSSTLMKIEMDVDEGSEKDVQPSYTENTSVPCNNLDNVKKSESMIEKEGKATGIKQEPNAGGPMVSSDEIVCLSSDEDVAKASPGKPALTITKVDSTRSGAVKIKEEPRPVKPDIRLEVDRGESNNDDDVIMLSSDDESETPGKIRPPSPVDVKPFALKAEPNQLKIHVFRTGENESRQAIDPETWESFGVSFSTLVCEKECQLYEDWEKTAPTSGQHQPPTVDIVSSEHDKDHGVIVAGDTNSLKIITELVSNVRVSSMSFKAWPASPGSAVLWFSVPASLVGKADPAKLFRTLPYKNGWPPGQAKFISCDTPSPNDIKELDVQSQRHVIKFAATESLIKYLLSRAAGGSPKIKINMISADIQHQQERLSESSKIQYDYYTEN